jgi:hypothetical protein
MNHPDLYPSQALAAPAGPLDLDGLERRALRSRAVAWGLIAGLPALGIAASLTAGVPLFAALMAGCFLLAAALVCRRALVTFTGKTLRLLVTARLVLVLVVGALLFCTSGSAWVAVVSAVLLWLTADRLLGRRALYDLWKLTRPRS